MLCSLILLVISEWTSCLQCTGELYGIIVVSCALTSFVEDYGLVREMIKPGNGLDLTNYYSKL